MNAANESLPGTVAKQGMLPAPQVSVIIVNYNGLRFLPACLASLHHAFIKYSFEIIVVDNASRDGSQEYLRSRPDIRLVESAINTGFTGGNNIGVREARGKLLLLLNNDTECLSQLDSFVDIMNDEHIGVAGCTLVYADGRPQPSVGHDHTPLRIILSWLGLSQAIAGNGLFSRYQMNNEFYRTDRCGVNWISGACLLTRSDLWHRLGGFDERLFMYCEDVDYCHRAGLAGFEIVYSAAATVLHHEGGGKPWAGAAALTRTARSYLLLMNKRYGIAAQCFVALALGLVFLLRALAYLLFALNKSVAEVARDKRAAYGCAGIYLISHALARSSLEKTI